MIEDTNNKGDMDNVDNITKGIISYKNFLDEFKKVNEDEVIMKEPNNPNTLKYILEHLIQNVI